MAIADIFGTHLFNVTIIVLVDALYPDRSARSRCKGIIRSKQRHRGPKGWDGPAERKRVRPGLAGTKTGLAVNAYLDRSHYPTDTAPAPEEIRQLRLNPHDTLPSWNYTITPNL